MLKDWIKLIADWPDSVALVDQSGAMQACSAEFTRWSGWSFEELQGKVLHDCLCAPARAFSHSEEFCPFKALAPDQQHETLLISKADTYLHAQLMAQALSLEGQSFKLVRFIDDSKLQHTLYELNRMSYFVLKSPLPLVEFSESGMLEYANAAMTERLLEYGYDDSGRMNLMPQNLDEILTSVIQTKESIDGVEVTTDSGDSWSWLFYYIEVESEDRVHGIATNITERLRREEIEHELAETASHLREQARKEQLAKITHEFRSPLNSMVGFAAILKTKLSGRLDEQETMFLDLIEQGGRKLADQISESLASARESLNNNRLAISKFGVQALCDELIAQVTPLAEKKHLSLELRCEEQIIESDRSKLVQILINFLDNAIKYTAQGSVALHAELEGETYVTFTVTDTGRGLSEQEQRDVFKDFYRTQGADNIEGTGLGLPVVQEIAKQLSAEVGVQSVLGQGSKFYIRLPL
jgi:two-component system, autoinducer 2 sensor kinase/phosphatase LuxQ